MVYNILSFGADSTGKINSAVAIQKAIDECTKTGGQVLVPSGTYLSGSFELKSDVDFHLEQGAVIVCSLKEEDISPLFRDCDDKTPDTGWDGGVFISAKYAKNVSLTGLGIIEGCGKEVFYEDAADGGMGECPLAVKGFRPRLSFFYGCENLTIKDVTIKDAAFWTLHMAGCEKVLVEGVRILNNPRGPNNDGIDPDACHDVIISGCYVECADDAIVVKATKPMAERFGGSENIIIKGCILKSHDSALKIGTETYGYIRNITLSDCIVDKCSRGVGIWVRDGGVVENIYIHDVFGSTLRYYDATIGRLCRWWGVGEPLFISATERQEPQADSVGVIRNIKVHNLDFDSEAPIFIAGEERSVIENVVIKDSSFRRKRLGKAELGIFDEQPSKRDCYKHSLPPLYARYVNNLTLSDVAFSLEDNPVFTSDIECENVKGLLVK